MAVWWVYEWSSERYKLCIRCRQLFKIFSFIGSMRMNKSDAYKYVIKNIDLSPNNKPVRIVGTILLVVALISGMRIYSEKNYLNAQIIDVHRQFEQKNRPLMLEILNNCQGDLADANLVQACVDDTRSQMVGSLKSKLIKARLSLLLWFVFWCVFLGVYVFIAMKQKQYRAGLKNESV